VEIPNVRITTTDIDQVQRAKGEINGSARDFYIVQALFYVG